MLNKFMMFLLFVLLAITSTYAASPEQPNSVPLDPNSLQTLIDKADKGDPNAQYNLGLVYFVPQGYKEAFKWWTKAAEQGYASAQFKLGAMYAYGTGIPQDYKEALKWWTKAAEQGHADAQSFLGSRYYFGVDVPQDYKEAVKWFTKAAEQDEPKAQSFLGSIYYEGKGVIEDYVEAYKWTLLAGMNGKDVATLKQLLAAKMSPIQIAEAQKLAKEFVAKKEKEKANDSGSSGLK